MPDREKVIRHFQDAIEASGANNKWRFVRADIIEEAVELLKEQEPVEPKKIPHSITYPGSTYICGNCKIIILEPDDNYCSNCGRAVKWK